MELGVCTMLDQDTAKRRDDRQQIKQIQRTGVGFVEGEETQASQKHQKRWKQMNTQE